MRMNVQITDEALGLFAPLQPCSECKRPLSVSFENNYRHWEGCSIGEREKQEKTTMSGQKSDPNVVELHELSKKFVSLSSYGDLLRLASTMETLEESDLGGHIDVWSYLEAKGFDPSFVQNVAKAYWEKSCDIVTALPYRYIVTDGGLKAERRLMAHLLRQVYGAIIEAM